MHPIRATPTRMYSNFLIEVSRSSHERTLKYGGGRNPEYARILGKHHCTCPPWVFFRLSAQGQFLFYSTSDRAFNLAHVCMRHPIASRFICFMPVGAGVQLVTSDDRSKWQIPHTDFLSGNKRARQLTPAFTRSHWNQVFIHVQLLLVVVGGVCVGRAGTRDVMYLNGMCSGLRLSQPPAEGSPS